jgi:thiamine biosynthesis lipoprotein ApbE
MSVRVIQWEAPRLSRGFRCTFPDYPLVCGVQSDGRPPAPAQTLPALPIEEICVATRRPPHPSRRFTYAVILASLVGLFGLMNWLPAGVPEAPREFTFQHEDILGTSLDLTVVAVREDDARHCEQVVLDEIERLRRLLSTYDPASEISRVNATSEPVACAPELIDVLSQYEVWQRRSAGALNGQLGELVRTWKDAEKRNQVPDDATLQRLTERVARPAWRIDAAAGTVTRLTEQQINVNAIGRGYILSRAARRAKAEVPGVRGLLVNLGGDLMALGDADGVAGGWRVGVADPKRPEHNAPVLTRVRLRDVAIATSAAYERYYTIDGRRYSHIFDPRTGRPAAGVSSSTVIAPDSAVANALATTLCVLPPEEGVRLVEATPGAACLVVDADGDEFRSAGFAAYELPQEGEKKEQAGKWPAGNQVSVTFTLIPAKLRPKRPYVAIWIEDEKGKPVRTITVWGTQPRWQPTLYTWWKLHGKNTDLVNAVTRATRPAGKYTVVWDGLDDSKKPVEPGTYKVQVEVHREHGKWVRQTGSLQCGGPDPVSITLAKTAETEDTQVKYGPKGK